jgi:ABC-2 type transport system ATP-binding protein
MIEIRGLTKRYGEKPALLDLNLSLARGEVFAFLGPNGAGKTTTLKILAGLVRPTEGAALVGGHDIQTDGLAARALMSYVPDEPYLYEKLTAREFLRMVGDLRGMSRAAVEERIRELAGQFGVTSFLDDLCESYSHGMKQRTVIAAALLHDPQVLIIDEVTVGLDPRSTRTLKDTLRRLAHDGGVTVLLSTHTLPVAEEIADRIGILHEGELVALGTLDELRAMQALRSGRDHARLEDLFLELTGLSADGAPAAP